MIAFLSKEFFVIDKSWAVMTNVAKYYDSETHSKDILMVYEGDMYYGMICHESYLKYSRCDADDYILKCYYVHKPNDELLWGNLHALLKSNAPFIPVFDQMCHLLYFAYEDTDGKKEQIKTILENVKENIIENKEVFSFAELNGIKIYNLNELGYVFWQLVTTNETVLVETIGEKWKNLYPEIGIKISNVPEENIMEYYPEIDPQTLFFKGRIVIQNIRDFYLVKIIESNMKRMQKNGIKVLTAFFTGAIDEKTTMDEEYRRKIGLTPGVPRSKWMEPLIREQIDHIEGREVSYEDWYCENDKKQWDYIKINGKLIFRKIFGEISGTDRIYLIGACMVKGVHVKSFDESLGGCIWKRLRLKGYDYSVICISLDQNDLSDYQKIFHSLLLSENDIVIIALQPNVKQCLMPESDIPVMEILKGRTGDWFWDCPAHTTYAGNKALAGEIVDKYFAQIYKERKDEPKILQIGKEFLCKEEQNALTDYIAQIKMDKQISEGQNIGAIVMNCNPMTKGHRYLIEMARKKVDYLYIFVVEEERSEFTFEERFNIVKRETGQLDNVIVVPSGHFILSYTTMPLYFEKEEKVNGELDATNDLRIFGEYIAPSFEISERFVGEEPIDMVTRQYNKEMKKILPIYNIKVTEIPRLSIENVVVSASRVRKLIKEKKWADVQALVTETVYARLRERYGK